MNTEPVNRLSPNGQSPQEGIDLFETLNRVRGFCLSVAQSTTETPRMRGDAFEIVKRVDRIENTMRVRGLSHIKDRMEKQIAEAKAEGGKTE